MWYRPWYLGLRAGMHLVRGDVAAPAMLIGYGRAPRRSVTHVPPTRSSATFVRRNQSPALVPRRAAEALRRSRPGSATHASAIESRP